MFVSITIAFTHVGRGYSINLVCLPVSPCHFTVSTTLTYCDYATLQKYGLCDCCIHIKKIVLHMHVLVSWFFGEKVDHLSFSFFSVGYLAVLTD